MALRRRDDAALVHPPERFGQAVARRRARYLRLGEGRRRDRAGDPGRRDRQPGGPGQKPAAGRAGHRDAASSHCFHQRVHVVLDIIEALAVGRHRDAEQIAVAGRRLRLVGVDPLRVELLAAGRVDLDDLAVLGVAGEQMAVRRSSPARAAASADRPWSPAGRCPALSRRVVASGIATIWLPTASDT